MSTSLSRISSLIIINFCISPLEKFEKFSFIIVEYNSLQFFPCNFLKFKRFIYLDIDAKSTYELSNVKFSITLPLKYIGS